MVVVVEITRAHASNNTIIIPATEELGDIVFIIQCEKGRGAEMEGSIQIKGVYTHNGKEKEIHYIYLIVQCVSNSASGIYIVLLCFFC